MRINYIPIFPLIWIILWTVQLITNFDYYMSTDNGKARIAIYGLMILIGVLLFLYFAFLSKGSKMIYRLSPKKHCPKCYAKVGDEGYYLIADVNKCGSHMCHFTDKEDQEYILEQSLMPIFGIKNKVASL